METLEQVLRAHAQEYPLMTPTDAVKLIYQNEFGGGHMIHDPEACRSFLMREYEDTPQIAGIPLLESIGNGMVRVMLCAMSAHGYSPDRLNGDFIRSAQEHQGDRKVFLQKLDLLRKVTLSGAFSFGIEELEGYLAKYKQAGYPAVSHSEQYRQAYQPAYRVVLQRLLLEELRK